MSDTIGLPGGGGAASDLSLTDKGNKQVLREFYAVTMTGSGYRVMNQMSSDECTPIVEKFTLKGESGIAIGKRLGSLHDPGMVGITNRGILVYIPNRRKGIPQTASETSTDRFGGHTSPVVALFLTRMDAEECLAEYPGLEKWDKRWIGHTRVTIEFIGKFHPLFVVDEDVYDKLQQ